jgi:hypothetical protein
VEFRILRLEYKVDELEHPNNNKEGERYKQNTRDI